MIMQVMYQNNTTSQIDSALLDQMIELNRIKMFKRSDGWAMVGKDQVRGSGGPYAGPDRRGLYGMMDENAYKIVT